MARTKKLSKEKRQSIITLRSESQSVWKIAKTCVSKCSRKNHQVLRRTGPHEEHPRTGRPRVNSAAEDKFIRVSTCIVPTVKLGGGGVMVWGCFAGDTVGVIFKIEGTLNQHGYHSILQRHAISSGLRLVGPSFIDSKI